MKVRRIQYNINYVHIITFRDEYKNAIAPFFGFDNLRYGIDNENTINESARLIFGEQNIALFVRKDGISFIYEGDSEDLTNQNGIIKIFWDLYERIKLFSGYKKTSRHSIVVHAVELQEDKLVKKRLHSNPYFNVNPFGDLTNFACIYEFEKNNKTYKFEFGNYSKKDIKAHELSPFDSVYNSDLHDSLGMMCRLETTEIVKSANHTKFKSFLNDAKNQINSFKLI